MIRKLKLLIAAALGFSTACSSVKDAPRDTNRRDKDDSVIIGQPEHSAKERPEIIVMYGVRRPLSEAEYRQQRLERMLPDSLPPVAETPREEDPHPEGK